MRLSLSDRPTGEAVLVAEVQDRVGNRLDRASVPFARRPTPGTLVLNELLFDPRADDFDDRPNQVEYVELRNLTDHTLTLTGLTLTDRPTETGTADTLRVGRRRGLAPGGFAVVAAAPKGAFTPQSSQLAAAFPDAPLGSDSVAYLPVQAPTLGLRNDGDRVRVHRRDTAVVADVAYSPDWHTAGLADPKGTALERISTTAGAEAADNWTSSTASAGGTPGAPNDASLAPPDDAPSAPGLPSAPARSRSSRTGRRASSTPCRPARASSACASTMPGAAACAPSKRPASPAGAASWSGTAATTQAIGFASVPTWCCSRPCRPTAAPPPNSRKRSWWPVP
ncbi:hypothetical protein GGP66_001800 [Salinibacter ruber]|uniref:LTD domain-containing protein n=1 Tax=Salinibacter ruber TaxID=146919 RepID=A0A9X2Z9U8_9BACT|nr:hypothetical protein [Salinibacter ruber]MCS3614097.1 hypothetical protein [Salinibacter ruber]MCS3674369.1 hypothetical protein [Salinibacter ruber]MCS3783506.1 hypothetical protein [Salinibacter ruber]MCS4035124.1 hypothetical protein [Salinibacter ruber]